MASAASPITPRSSVATTPRAVGPATVTFGTALPPPPAWPLAVAAPAAASRSATPTEASARARGASASRLLKAAVRKPLASHSTGRSWTRSQLIDLRLQTNQEFAAATQARSSTPNGQPLRSSTPVHLRAGPGSYSSRPTTPLRRRDLSPRAGSPRSACEVRPKRPSFDLHGWLLAQHGTLQAAFRAIDSDHDGRVDTADIVEELRRTGPPAMLQAQGKAALRAAHDLGERWRGARGGAGLPEFLEAFGSTEERILCARERFFAGEVAEVAYCLPVESSSLLDSSRSTAAGSSPARTPQRPGALQQPALPLPFLALVPASISSRLPAPNAAAAAALRPVDPLQRSGTLHIRLPLATSGPHEWRLFDAPVEAMGPGRQLGAGVPCLVEPPSSPYTPPPRLPPEPSGELVELKEDGGSSSTLTPASTAQGRPLPKPCWGAEGSTSVGSAGMWSDDILVRLGTSQLDPPSELQARCVRSPEAQSGTHVHLSWEHQCSDSEEKPSGYCIHWQALEPGASSCCQGVGGHARDCVIGPLYSSSGYKFWVTSVSDSGESGPSARVEVRTGFWATPGSPSPEGPPSLATKPGPLPGPPVVASRDSGSAELHWHPPTDDGGLPVSYYEVRAIPQTDAESPGVLTAKSHAFSCEYQMEGLDRSLRYSFQVRPVGPLGPGPWTEEQNSGSLASAAAEELELLSRIQIAKDAAWQSLEPISQLRQAESAALQLEPPQELLVVENAARQVVLSWAAAPASAGGAEVLRYRVVASPGPVASDDTAHEETWDVPRHEGADGMLTFAMPVVPGRRYSFSVAAVAVGGEASAYTRAEEVLTAVAPPLGPGALRLSGVTSSSAVLSWDPPLDGGGSEIERYGVHVFEVSSSSTPEASPMDCAGAAEGPRLLRVDVTEDARPARRVEGLRPNTSYSLKVCAISAAGAGSFSEPSEVFTTPSCGQPPAPQWPPMAAAVGVPTRAALSWEAPELDGGHPITHYVVLARRTKKNEAKESEGLEANTEDVFGGTEERLGEWEVQATTSRTAHTITGLAAGAAYEFAVRAVSAAGESELSPASVPYQTGPRTPGPPGRPWLHGPASTAPYDPLIAFTMPEDDGDAPVRLFRCIAFVEGQPEATTEVALQVTGVDGNVVMAAAGTLPGNYEYQFAVQACNDGGWGPLGASSPPAFVWRPSAPGRPCAAPAATGSGFTLAWEAALDEKGQLITEYYVYVRSFPSSASAPPSADAEPGSLVASGAGPAGGGDPAAVAPAGEEVSRQLVRASPTRAGEAEEGSSRCGSSAAFVSAEVAGLRTGRRYTFRVQAAEGGEPRPVSEESEALELQSGVPSPPGKPTVELLEVATSPSSSGGGCLQSVRVEWPASESNGGFAIYGYRVHCHCLSKAALEMFEGQALADVPLQAPWVESSKVRGVAALQGGVEPKILHTICGVGPGAPYCFEVQAINCQGASAVSRRSDLVHAPPTAPSVCRGLVARRSGVREVSLCWQPPAESGGLPITSYLVTRTLLSGKSPSGEAVCEAVEVEGQNSHWVRHSISRLPPATEYGFSVCAVNGRGRGREVEAPWTILVPEEAPCPDSRQRDEDN